MRRGRRRVERGLPPEHASRREGGYTNGCGGPHVGSGAQVVGPVPDRRREERRMQPRRPRASGRRIKRRPSAESRAGARKRESRVFCGDQFSRDRSRAELSDRGSRVYSPRPTCQLDFFGCRVVGLITWRRNHGPANSVGHRSPRIRWAAGIAARRGRRSPSPRKKCRLVRSRTPAFTSNFEGRG